MRKYYIINESGFPIPVRNEREYAEWAVKNNLSKMTRIVEKSGLSVDIVTAFDYTEGYFTTFKLDGIEQIELEKSTSKPRSELVHQKYVEKLSAANKAIKSS